jgi:hypothetical protein
MKQLYLSLVLGIFHLADMTGCQFSLRESIEMEIANCEYMRYHFSGAELYYEGKIDAYKDVLNKINFIQP